jgi:hypothetical protein
MKFCFGTLTPKYLNFATTTFINIYKSASIHLEDGEHMALQNAGILLQYYITSQPRRLQLESSPP